MPSSSDPRNLRAKWQRALEERRKAGAAAPPLDVTPRPARTGKSAGSDAPVEHAPGAAHKPDASVDAPVERGPLSTRKPAGSVDAPIERGAKRKPAASVDAPVERGPLSTRKPAGSVDAPIERGAKSRPAASVDAPVERAGGRSEHAAGDDAPASKEPEGEPRKSVGPGAAEGAKKLAATSSTWSSVVAALVLVGGVGFALRTFLGPDGVVSESGDAEAPGVTAGRDSDDVPIVIPTGKPVAKARCSEVKGEPFVIGDAPAPKPAATASDGEDPGEDELAPFAVELGRGVHLRGGPSEVFAVGTQRQAEGGTVSMVATLDVASGAGKLVRLARSRGDLDPPVVAAGAGGSILAAMMEPNASGRAIRIAKIDGERVTWGPELSEGRDESLAVDIATVESRALVVWDDVPVGRERSVIELATFDAETMRGSGARAVTPGSIDADVPRLAARAGGFWLSYIVHGEPPTQPTAAKDEGGDDAGVPEKKGKGGASENADDSDTEAAGEAIAHQWIELVPLDESGVLVGAPRAVTPKDGRVIGYDLDEGADGKAMILYREDDTPNGSNGGRVKLVVAELGGVSEPMVIADEGVGAGVPQLHGTWVVIHSLSGPVQLGALGAKGEVQGELSPETSLKHGEILTAAGDTFLVATPAGRAMKLGLARCSR